MYELIHLKRKRGKTEEIGIKGARKKYTCQPFLCVSIVMKMNRRKFKKKAEN